MDQDFQGRNGQRISYTVMGEGPDVVFIHGWASSRRMWDHILPKLAQRFRCWALDLPGFGDSDRPAPGWYSIPNFTAAVADFIERQRLVRPRLVGHSMGGMIALNVGSRHPNVLERLVAINPVVTGRVNLRPLARPDIAQRVLDWVLRLSPVVLRPLAHPMGNRVHGLHFIRRRTEDFCRCSSDTLLSSGRAIVDFDLSPVLSQITAPTLLLVGKQDANVPPSESRLAAREIPGALLHLMRGGHLLTDDWPDKVIAQLDGFLA